MTNSLKNPRNQISVAPQEHRIASWTTILADAGHCPGGRRRTLIAFCLAGGKPGAASA